MNSFMEKLPYAVQMIIFAIFIVWAALTFLIPFVIYFILVELRKQTAQLKTTDQTPLHQTKLLTEIRNALQSMQAVGIDETGREEPEPLTLPPIRTPSSVPPNRERFRQ